MEVLSKVLREVFTRTSTVRQGFLSSHRFLLEPGCLNKNPDGNDVVGKNMVSEVLGGSTTVDALSPQNCRGLVGLWPGHPSQKKTSSSFHIWKLLGKLRNLGSDDLLSRLPDEILVSILSSLPLKTAAATSSLSRRWRYLWCQTDRLLFENYTCRKLWTLMDTYSNKYISWVDHIIDQHKSPTIDEFKISFGLEENAYGAINKWVKFAISKDVKTLELDLTSKTRTCRNYCFPNKIFDLKCGSSLKRHSLNDPVMEIKFLKSLILRRVDVDDEGLKKILNNCLVLEHLYILGSRKLVKPEIHGNGLALKNLDMSSCIGVESIEICDSNIEFFNCRGGSSITFRFDNLQKLENICISKGDSWEELNDTFYQLSRVPCLQVLEFYLHRTQGPIELHPFPMLQKLKQLTIKVIERKDDGFLMLPYLIEACPNLRRLTIEDGLHNLDSGDLLSRLPDEIIVSILSKLPLRDAVVTSKLSRRWRYLWCQTDRLVFEDCGKRWSLMDTISNEKSNKYMSWVDHIIHQHNGPTIDKFKICFGLDDNAKDAIDKWIEYAVSKNVQTLELSLVRSRINYSFPNKIFDWKCGSSLKGHSFNDPVMEIKCLKSLVLNHVDVDDEGLKKILSNCPVLENLFIRDSSKLVKLEIHGKGLALKNLYMISCHGLESVEICDSNIVFFGCRGGSPITSRFDNLQKLEKICIDKGHSWKELNDTFCQLSRVPCLQVLELNLCRVQGATKLHPFRMLQKLKQLTIKVVEREDDGFLMLPYLLEACPNLRRLTIVEVLHNLGSYDQLSRLPDEILVSILSSLPIKDAAVTSLFSRRWRFLWCQIDRLIFADEGRWSLSCIDHIILQHKSPTIDEFKISFGLDENANGAINKWVKFAISKDVKTLELDLTSKTRTCRNYCFPNKLFDLKCGSSLKRHSLNYPVMEIKFLKSLILRTAAWPGFEKKNREVRQMNKKPHQHLEVVEMVPYHGWTSDFELFMYFIQNCVVLKKLVIGPTGEDENGVRYNAQQQLKPGTPAGVELDELHNLDSVDLLSRLPDEIIVSILSKLPLRDAVVTSKLSRRWRYLWCQTDRLVFEDCGKRWSLMDTISNEKSNKYMSWVDHIIHQHNGPTIDKFKICFGLDENAKDAIDKWIDYAVSKNVQTLELSLVRSRISYSFPIKIFDWKCGSSLKGHSFNDPVMEIKCLKSLVLNHVDVDDEGLKKILSNCSVLENLFIRDSSKLVKPEIHGKGLTLKNLYMISCYGLESVEICDSNIVFFGCRGGSPITIRFDNLQKLEKICIEIKGHSWKELNDTFCQLSRVPCLQVLELNLCRVQGAIELHPFRMLQKLKQLTIKVVEREDDGFLVLPYLLEACPNLRRLTIVEVLHNLGSYDQLSRLSDEILVSILSSLPIKDAAVTSLFSRRWRFLWCQVDRLIFADEGRWSLSCIDDIIRQHNNPTIDKLKICFDLDMYAKGTMSKLIKFAISKNIKMLELDFDRDHGSSLDGQSFSVWVAEIKSLKSLKLKCVDVNDEGLRKILSNCPVLEHLSVVGSLGLVKAEIHGKGLALKTLVMRSCTLLESIEILDSNIVSFSCDGLLVCTFRLDNLQKLEKICIGKLYLWQELNDIVCQISYGVPNLQVLELELYGFQLSALVGPFFKLQKLKQLIIRVVKWDADDLLRLTSLLEACPNLQRLTIRDKLHNLGSDDLLSRLPDDILVSIMSKVPLRDAVVTSKLSRRWRYLWCQTDRLVFEDKERWSLMDTFSNKESGSEYMSWVDHIIYQHKSPTIDEFQIRFGLDKNAKGALDRWIKYAISKNVHTLELSLLSSNAPWERYCFPNNLFDTTCGSLLKPHPFLDPVMEIKFLKCLILKFVDVDDDGLKRILNNCPVLEHLSIVYSCKLVKPKIHGKGLVLKNLDIISFTLRFDNLQKLEKICIDSDHSWKELNDMFCKLSHVPCLQVLELNLYHEQGAIELHHFHVLQKLKQLIINVVEDNEDGFFVLPSLLEACPKLERLRITRFSWPRPREEKPNMGVRQMAKKPHQSLWVVEMFEYHGWTSDVELFMYFIQNCVALKKLVVEPTVSGTRMKYEEKETAGTKQGEFLKILTTEYDDLHDLGLDDLLSRLPDEILVAILSSLPLKEAAATSLLSRRWRYLWCHTDRLLFEDMERWGFIQNELDSSYSDARDEYMSWVDHIIHQHKSPTIDEFQIRFGLDENAKAVIDTWIKYAISKNVQTLELFLLRIHATCGNYCFPNKIFDRYCGSSLKRHSFNDPLMEIKFLKSLILRCVDVDDEGVKKILNNCPVLEHLFIMCSRKLVKPEIHGKGLALKSLDIRSCSGLESVEICDSNIVFFNCFDASSVTLRFDNLQKLEKICIDKGHSWKELNDMFCQISRAPYLQVLELDLCYKQGDIELHPFPMLQKLKQLIVTVLGEDENDGFFVLPSLLEACPNLQRLTIKRFSWPREVKPNRGVRQMAKKPHQSLEVVKMVVYRGWASDLELFMYFIQNCVALKKLVIKPTTRDEDGARYHAQQQLKHT
ncbi:hypothetical protein OSB04_026332 [Centaurea solstitialis]|uniref:F-box domain-containing protein n=1 Tax=Centaurea solstitialis TaxID=347529 RepID=A0AA38W970_9ASTR|nr:hypothetical protein OSB04_026332 [Centaurea solstitialis]